MNSSTVKLIVGVCLGLSTTLQAGEISTECQCKTCSRFGIETYYFPMMSTSSTPLDEHSIKLTYNISPMVNPAAIKSWAKIIESSQASEENVTPGDYRLVVKISGELVIVVDSRRKAWYRGETFELTISSYKKLRDDILSLLPHS